MPSGYSVEDICRFHDRIAELERQVERLRLTSMESETPCCRCGGVVVEFSVPNDAWNTIIRDDGRETDQEYLSLDCSARVAAEKVGQLRQMMIPCREAED
jgi:hypothetical protein